MASSSEENQDGNCDTHTRMTHQCECKETLMNLRQFQI